MDGILEVIVVDWHDMTVGLTGLAGFIVVGVVNIGLLLVVNSQQSETSMHPVAIHPDPTIPKNEEFG